jgi:uncharacterized protein (TIGR02594 family)
MVNYNAAILETAGGYLGLKEWPGARHNDQIVDFFEDVGHSWVQDDETPWCAAFVGSVLAQLGLAHSGKLNARSYETYGHNVYIRDARAGDIAVFYRGDPNGWQGHVAFVVRFSGDKVLVRGGNQGNAVSDAWYPITRLICIRRATKGTDSETGRPILRKGDKSPFVKEAQTLLAARGYHVGAVDGIMGRLTEQAVRTLQSDSSLLVDGEIGDNTWKVLLRSDVVAPERSHTEETLREADSTIIAKADEGEKTVKKGVLGVGTAISLDTVLAVENKLGGADGAASKMDGWLSLIADRAVPIGILAACVFLYFYLPSIMQAIRNSRVEDARSGRHIGR